jgi:branched-chain amino acid transport system permease protein
MMNFYLAYQPIIDFFLLNLGFAYSQQVALRAGVFSVATAGFGALGAYTSAILVTRSGVSPVVAVAAATVVGTAMGFLLSVPLARLRGVFQAIATLAFVEVIVSMLYYAEGITGGAIGINNIPRMVGTPALLAAVAAVMYVTWAIGRSGVGRAFDALRQDETVAACLGVSIRNYHALAFVLSGAIGGLFGGLQSLYVFSIEPGQFGFGFMVAILTAIVLGGRGTLIGPVAGCAILALLPEIARPLAENRPLVNGVILIAVIIYLPQGVGDGLILQWRNRRSARRARAIEEASRAVPSA